MRAEIAHYRANLHRAVDAASLATLREECAAIVGCTVDDLLSAIVFTPFDDTVPALRRLGEEGVRRAVVSNWDVSLHEVLDRTGLTPLLDGAISSAEVGAAKPDPAPVHAALALAGVPAADAWLIGDEPEADGGAARAAGVRPILIDRARGDTLTALLWDTG
jgi:putative hydrolase of the HAD superfamily